MKKTLYKFFAALVSFVMILQLTSCGKQEDSQNNQVKYIYKSTSAEVNEEIAGNFDSYSYYGGRIYFLSENFTPDQENENSNSEFYLYSVKTDGSDFKSVKIDVEKSAYICSPEFDSDGKGYYVQFKNTEEGYSYLLKTIDSEGNETSSTDISESINKNTTDFNPRFVCIDKSGNIYICDYSNIVVFDKNYKFQFNIPDLNYIQKLCIDRSGKVYVFTRTEAGFGLCGIDPVNKSLESPVDFPFDMYTSTLISGNEDYDFFVNNSTDLYGFNIGEESTSLLNWVSSGISVMEVQSVFYTGKDSSGECTFVSVGKSYPYEYPKLSVLTKQKFKNDGKKEIVIAGTDMSIDKLIENAAVKFNNVNEDYYITIKKYPWRNSEQLNLDITSGKIPDILFSDSSTPIEDYIAKDLFTDLYQYIDKDEELKREDFVQNLLTSCEKDGKLYRFTDRFMISTVLGKTSIFGEEMGIDVEKLKEITDQRLDDIEVLPGFSQMDVLRYSLEMSGDEYIDYKARTCSFNSESFINLLEYSNQYMSTIDAEKYFNDSFWQGFETMYSDENALLMITYLTGYLDVYCLEHACFGEKVTAVGFPYENRIGTSFVMETSFSISEKSEVKDGAWEFIRTILKSEYQDGCSNFPVRYDSLDKKAAGTLKNGSDEDYFALILLGQMALPSSGCDCSEMKQEDIDYLNEIIGSANGIISFDDQVREIIFEEAAPYFNGDKTAQEAADLIQSRVQLYLDEKS